MQGTTAISVITSLALPLYCYCLQTSLISKNCKRQQKIKNTIKLLKERFLCCILAFLGIAKSGYGLIRHHEVNF